MKTVLVGDFCAIEKNMDVVKAKDLNKLFNDTLPVFEGNDLMFVNVECAITESENAIKKFGPNLKVCREAADVLKSIGTTVCGLSNNHIFDYGREGALDTIKALEAVGIEYTGFGKNYEDSRKNYIFSKDGERIALVAVCEHEYSYALENRMGSRPFDPFETMEDIRKAKKEADRVIVLYHGAKEMCQYPTPRIIKACREMVHNGADVILCQHTHCISCYEEYKGAHILYGQGNFNFINENAPEIWNQSLIVKYDTKTNEMEFIPTCNTEFGIELAKDELKDKIMREFEERNDSLKDGRWIKGWREFCESVKDVYLLAAQSGGKITASSTEEFFAHYIDCEAHSDVWKELFKTWNHENEL